MKEPPDSIRLLTDILAAAETVRIRFARADLRLRLLRAGAVNPHLYGDGRK